MTYGRVFLSNKKRLTLRVAENVILSLIAFFFPRFTDILDLNILAESRQCLNVQSEVLPPS